MPPIHQFATYCHENYRNLTLPVLKPIVRD